MAMKHGRILCPNAGVDRSNTETGTAIGWPMDALSSVRRLRKELEEISGKKIGVLISDSGCRPGRKGVTAFALTVSGFEPLRDEAGKPDIFSNTLRITKEAFADQLATAANIVMGNAAQATPGAVIRGHGITLTNFCDWVDGIEPEEDLFHGILVA
jgi:coenzyme F420-0:L-glutamate ligase/coenzyme F420-1:gamma-L-glutamate ligase